MAEEDGRPLPFQSETGRAETEESRARLVQKEARRTDEEEVRARLVQKGARRTDVGGRRENQLMTTLLMPLPSRISAMTSIGICCSVMT